MADVTYIFIHVRGTGVYGCIATYLALHVHAHTRTSPAQLILEVAHVEHYLIPRSEAYRISLSDTNLKFHGL
jgi:hypothetical protein